MRTPLILIVDDKPENLTVLGELLQRRYAVRVANSGVRALRLAGQQPQPALIVVDVLDGLMPHMASHELLEQLQAQPATASIPVIVLSSQNDWTRRPISPTLLLAQVQAALQNGMDQAGARTLPVPPMLQVPGLTMSQALLYLPGRDQLFERVLRQFAQLYRTGMVGLAAVLDAQDWPAAQGLLHDLRGACGAIGATLLMAQARLLEQGLPPDVAPDVPPDLLPMAPHPHAAGGPAAWALSCRALDAAVVALVATIDATLGPPPQPAPAPPAAGDQAALHAAMDALSAQLRLADFAAGAAFRGLAPALSAAYGAAAVQAVGDALSRHDYDAALLALHGLRHPTGTLTAGRKV